MSRFFWPPTSSTPVDRVRSTFCTKLTFAPFNRPVCEISAFFTCSSNRETRREPSVQVFSADNSLEIARSGRRFGLGTDRTAPVVTAW